MSPQAASFAVVLLLSFASAAAAHITEPAVPPQTHVASYFEDDPDRSYEDASDSVTIARGRRAVEWPVDPTLPETSTAEPSTPVPTIPAGMSMVKDITDDMDTPPRRLVAVAGQLVFLAGDDKGYRLWRSDGTEDGTVPVGDRPRFDCLAFECEYGFELIESDGLVFLTSVGGRGIWRSDGTEDGTVRLAPIDAGFLHDIDGVPYFVAGRARDGYELWRTDGTVAGTRQVRDIAPGHASGICPSTGGDFCTDEAYSMGQLHGRIYFGADDGVRGDDLWVSDGTRRGTRPHADIRPDGRDGHFTSFPAWFQPSGDQLFFAMDDREHGYELWVTDGTRRGTRLVRDIRPGRKGGIREWNPPIGTIGDEILFIANDGPHGHELWRSDGTRGGTAMISDIKPGRRGGLSDGSSAVALGDVILFTADDGEHGVELWRTDGTPEGTRMVRDIRPGRDASVPESLTAFDGSVFFVADDGVHGRELWRSDGTTDGTGLIADVNVLGPTPCAEDSYICDDSDDPMPTELTVVGDTLFFTADDGVHGTELWGYKPLTAATDQ